MYVHFKLTYSHLAYSLPAASNVKFLMQHKQFFFCFVFVSWAKQCVAPSLCGGISSSLYFSIDLTQHIYEREKKHKDKHELASHVCETKLSNSS